MAPDARRAARQAIWLAARLAAAEAAMVKLAHDLRGALSPALLSAERLQASADPTQRRPGEIMVRSVERAAGLVNEALAQTRADAGRPQTRTDRLRALTDAAAAQAGADQPGAARMVVRSDIDPAIEVTTDAWQFTQMLCELLHNASAAGASQTTLGARFVGRTLMLSVADDGPGLPADMQPDPFRRRADEAGSAGCGIAIARLLARAQGGRIRLVESGPGGTVFEISLPIPRQPAA